MNASVVADRFPIHHLPAKNMDRNGDELGKDILQDSPANRAQAIKKLFDFQLRETSEIGRKQRHLAALFQ